MQHSEYDLKYVNFSMFLYNINKFRINITQKIHLIGSEFETKKLLAITRNSQI